MLATAWILFLLILLCYPLMKTDCIMISVKTLMRKTFNRDVSMNNEDEDVTENHPDNTGPCQVSWSRKVQKLMIQRWKELKDAATGQHISTDLISEICR